MDPGFKKMNFKNQPEICVFIALTGGIYKNHDPQFCDH